MITCVCGHPFAERDDVTERWRYYTDADACPVYVGRRDYCLAQATECPECGAVHVRYRAIP